MHSCSSWYIAYLCLWGMRGIQCCLKLIYSSKLARGELWEYVCFCILSVYLLLYSHILLGQERMSSEPDPGFLLMYGILSLACQTSLGLEFFMLNHVTWLCSQAWDSGKQLQCDSPLEKKHIYKAKFFCALIFPFIFHVQSYHATIYNTSQTLNTLKIITMCPFFLCSMTLLVYACVHLCKYSLLLSC